MSNDIFNLFLLKYDNSYVLCYCRFLQLNLEDSWANNFFTFHASISYRWLKFVVHWKIIFESSTNQFLREQLKSLVILGVENLKSSLDPQKLC